MSRILIVVPPMTGHVNPTVSLGMELVERGHEVAWCGQVDVVDRLLPEGVQFFPVGAELAARVGPNYAPADRRGPEGFRFLWEGFLVPYARETAPEVTAAVECFAPDLLLVDQQALAGAAVAKRAGLRWVTSASTSAELVDPFARMPKIRDWVRWQLLDLQIALGVPPEGAAHGDLRFSDELILAFTTEALVGPLVTAEFPQVRFVGASINRRPEPVEFPWAWLSSDSPTVLVSLGTVGSAQDERFLAMAIESLSDRELQAVIVAPSLADRLPPHGPNILLASRVPQLALLPHVDAVVCHGGHNTVCEALAHGLPLVVAPVRDDHPLVADQVVAAGAGRRVKFGRIRPPAFAAAVDAVLYDPDLRAGAARVKESFDRAGGAPAAAAAIEQVLCGVPS